MSTAPKNIRLDAAVLAALQEAAAREHKSLDEMAGKAVIAGLQADRSRRLQDLLAYGHRKGAESGIREEEVPEIVHQWREEQSQRGR